MFPRGNRIETPSLSACGGGYAPDLIDESRSAAFRTSFSMMPLQRRSAGAAFFFTFVSTPRLSCGRIVL